MVTQQVDGKTMTQPKGSWLESTLLPEQWCDNHRTEKGEGDHRVKTLSQNIKQRIIKQRPPMNLLWYQIMVQAPDIYIYINIFFLLFQQKYQSVTWELIVKHTFA